MTVLANKFGDQNWFANAASYLSSRLPSVEARLQTAFRYVELHSENRKAFSYEFASILRDSGSAFGSVVEALLQGTMGAPKRRYTFANYRRFLRQEVPDIHKRTVHWRPCFPNGTVVPFEELQTATGTPKWWVAYNNVKHSEYDEFRMGNLENCVKAVSALALLGRLMGLFIMSDQLFVNVGVAYDEESVDMSDERRLFPRQHEPISHFS
jgi:hypothetical protein